MLSQAWRRLVHKQWLIFYPLALAVINTLAFLAVYSAAGGELGWSEFFASNYVGERWQWIGSHFVSGFSFTPALGIAVFAGLAVCLFTAMLRAPLFRAIVGPSYPLAPRTWEETARLTLFYVFSYLVLAVLPAAVPSSNGLSSAALWVALAVNLFIVYTDYIIVFEGLAFLPALRRSAHLLTRRWPPALVIFVAFWLVQLGLATLYSRYYEGAEGVFLLVPLSEILVFSLVPLLFDILFISLYERIRQSGN